MSAVRRATLLATALLLAPPSARALEAQQVRAQSAVSDSFPHPRHGRLFTSCTSCHEGITTGDSAAARP